LIKYIDESNYETELLPDRKNKYCFNGNANCYHLNKDGCVYISYSWRNGRNIQYLLFVMRWKAEKQLGFCWYA